MNLIKFYEELSFDVNILKKAQEILALNMYEIEKNNKEIPKVSKITEIKLKENQCVLMVTAYMPLYRKAIKNKAVKKTLTIPQWLNEVAEENNINFSLTLQKLNLDKVKSANINKMFVDFFYIQNTCHHKLCRSNIIFIEYFEEYYHF